MSAIYKISSAAQGNPQPVVVLCPSCRREGTFTQLGNVMDAAISFVVPPAPNAPKHTVVNTVNAGSRMCPNVDCQAHVFVIYRGGYSQALQSFPVGRIDFDTTDLPANVARTFEEALTCFTSECYSAAAIMIRRTLEEVCEDRGVTGGDLQKRIEALRTKLTLPQELFEAMQHLRLLGNDAAHIQAKTYDNVGREEVDAGITLAREVIKSAYQYKSLLAKLQNLKRT